MDQTLKGVSNLTEIVQNRRTIHHFTDQAVPQEALNKALGLTVYAPNHHLTYPYRFYPLGEQSKESFLQYAEQSFADRDPATAATKLARWKKIPGWIAVTQKISEDEKTFHEDFATLSIALYIMMQSFYEDGIGSKWSTGSLFFKPAAYDILGIDPKEEIIRGMFWYGYPEKTPNPFPKPALDRFVKPLP